MRLAALLLTFIGAVVLVTAAVAWGVAYVSSASWVASVSGDLSGLAQEVFGGLVLESSSGADALASSSNGSQSSGSGSAANHTALLGTQGKQVSANASANTSTTSQLLATASCATHSALAVALDQRAADQRRGVARAAAAAVERLLGDALRAVQSAAEAHALRLVNFSAHPEQELTLGDCQLAASLCSAIQNVGDSPSNGTLSIVAQSGVYYECGALVGVTFRLPQPPPDATTWRTFTSPTYPSAAPLPQRTSWLDRCLRTSALPADAGANATQCAASAACAGPCAADPRCAPAYQHFLAYTGSAQLQLTDVTPADAVASAILSYPVYDEATFPRHLLAVGSIGLPLADFDRLLPDEGLRVLLLRNDSNLTVLGSAGPSSSCAQHGLRGYSSLQRACDPQLAAFGRWLAGARAGPGADCSADPPLGCPWTWRSSSLLWDVFPISGEPLAYLIAVATNITSLANDIAAAEQPAQHALDLLATTLGRPASVPASGLVPATPTNLSHRSPTALEVNLTDFIAALSAKHRAALAGGLVVAGPAVAGVFILAAALGALFAIRVTGCLAEIRSTMQDVAAMKFDALMLRTNSEVTEVQQLQRAFVALVTRLLEYRSFIPAGLFHSPTAEDLAALPEKPASRSRTSSRRTSQQTPPPRQAPPIAVLPHQNSLTPTSVVSHRTSPGPTVRREMLSNSPNRMSRRTVAVMVVNALGFRSFVAVAGECHVEYVLGHYVATVHDFVSKARGHVDVVLGDQIFATFNAHVACPDAHTAAVATALDLRAVLTAGLLAGLLRIQIGVSGGQVFSGCTGYQPFKTLVTVGTPMKVAATFAHLANMDGAAVLVDPAVEERVRYSFKLRPVDAVFFPLSGQHSFPLSRAVTVFLVESRVIFQEAEWIYQVQDADCSEGWPGVFSNVLTADTQTQASLFLRRYLSLHPEDFYALRLQSRMPQWCPKRGVELREGPDVVQPEPPVPAAGLLSMAFLEEPPVPLFSPRAR
eukprot:EG_transcript_507